MPLLPGERLAKRYRIASLLSEGPYGALYRAWDAEVQRDVAIREILDTSPQMRKRFRQEAQRLARFSHSRLPAVLDHFALDDVGQYLVSAYVDGVDLRALQMQYGRLPPDLIIDWLQSACAPLQYLHQKGAVHLNLTPANVRLAPDGTIFVVNMALPGLELPPRAGGYDAPEYQAQDAVGPAADIYSLGATLYALLTGDAPPPALKIASGLADLRPAREVNPDAPPYLSLVAGRALSQRPDARYETVADFAQALERPYGRPTPTNELRRTPAAHFAPVNAPPPRRPTRRHQIEQRTIIALSVLLVIFVVMAIAVIQFDIFSEPQQTVDETAATATFVSAVIEAATALAPTPSPSPDPTSLPTPTPRPLVTETGMRMLFMPGGIFRMGVDDGEPDEGPSNLIRLSPYYIDETEVTNAQYAQCVEAGACRAPARRTATYHPAYYGDAAYDNYPVIFVNWFDADAYCEWRGARLPTEAEWEKAAGFDPDQAIILRYPWGDAFDGVKLNFCDANCTLEKRNAAFNDGHRDTAPVGTYPDGRSPIGLYDMAGNVMEWVSDWYDPRAYRSLTDTNPMGPPEGEFKSIRGGSFLSAEEEVRVYARTSFDPTVARANLGFRCALDAP